MMPVIVVVVVVVMMLIIAMMVIMIMIAVMVVSLTVVMVVVVLMKIGSFDNIIELSYLRNRVNGQGLRESSREEGLIAKGVS